MPEPRWREATQRLHELGFDEELAAAYLQVLVHGPSRPHAVALALHTSRAEAHRRLRRLEAMGLALQDGERPVAYRPVEPSVLFDLLAHASTKRAMAALRFRHEAAPLLQELSRACMEAEQSTFRHLTGRRAYYEEVHRLLDTAREELVVLNTHPAGAQMAESAGIWERVQDLPGEGVRRRIVVVDSPALRRGPWAAWVRILAADRPMRFVMVDGRSLLVCVGNDPVGGLDAPLERAVRTGAPGFLAAHRLLFDRLWREAQSPEPPGAIRR